ncbi:transposase [Virgibacillus proomii]|uniref:transposase n=1 Tax=Virgibacillus proomii TaxID=84407 RepID=UPI001C10456E|nr:transposase [Virgibacillus proomii]MBU5266673.1 IS110 family transposase [Virgibacillus proomii]
MVKELITPIPGVKEMTDINGIGEITIASFLAQTGELNKFTHPEQLIKLAGLNLKLATTGKWKGKTVRVMPDCIKICRLLRASIVIDDSSKN